MKVPNLAASLPLIAGLFMCSCSRSPQERAMLYYKAGAEAMEASRESNAIVSFTAAIEIDPKFSPAYLGRGACYYELKDFKAAEADFSAALQLEPMDARAYSARGAARLNLREADGAVEDFNKVVEMNSEDAEVFRNRAAALAMAREYEKAVADCSKAIEMDGDDAGSYRLRASSKASMKDYPAALADYNKAIELAPQNGEVYAGRGTVRMEMDDFPAAASDLSKALELSPKSPYPYAIRGLLREKQGDNDGALADFNRSIQVGPWMPEPYEVLGFLQYDLVRWPAAQANLRKALELKCVSQDPRFYVWLIRAQSGEQGSANKDLTEYLNTLKGDKAKEWPASVARYLTGVLPETEFFDQATSTAKRPSAIRGQKCESFYYAAMKRKLAGDKQGAAEFFQKAIDTGDDNNFTYFSSKVELRKQ